MSSVIAPSSLGKQDLTLPAWKVNLLSVLIILPLAMFLVASYGLLWGWDKLLEDLVTVYADYLLTALVLLGGIVVHELLHALVWRLFGRLSFGDFTFGFNVSGMAPFVHCAAPMSARVYRLGTVAPGVLMGLFPYGLALVSGNSWLMSYGLIFTLVAAGDFLMLWKVRKVDPGDRVQDHPTLAGCEVLSW